MTHFVTVAGVRHALGSDGTYHPVSYPGVRPKPAPTASLAEHKRRARTDAGHTSMYWLYDDRGHLLYVGIAGNPGRRFEQHRATKSWWGQVSIVKLQHFATRRDALDAEAEAIRSDHPAHNVAHTQ